ncbi:uncharacterized protein C8orf58 homolog isoform X2 [Castor canadensis]|uniref:Uncharacterized protein C8orf58 homolog isoform X2 n=1 Tax=Castor canadensis TaxID=51338 RepID=A0AC58L273_CASCN
MGRVGGFICSPDTAPCSRCAGTILLLTLLDFSQTEGPESAGSRSVLFALPALGVPQLSGLRSVAPLPGRRKTGRLCSSGGDPRREPVPKQGGAPPRTADRGPSLRPRQAWGCKALPVNPEGVPRRHPHTCAHPVPASSGECPGTAPSWAGSCPSVAGDAQGSLGRCSGRGASGRERAMLRRRHVFTVEQLGSRDGASKDLAPGCVVPGVTSTYRRIPDAAYGCSLDFRKREGELRRLGRQMPLFKLASQDSGMEMVVGDSPLAILPGLSQDSLNLEPRGSPELSAQRGRLLASRKLEQVLERSRRLPRLPGQRHSLQLPIKTECGVSFCAAGGQGSTEAETKLEAGLEVTEVVEGMAPEAWACLPGQGLRYLEHLCLVLEQMARLQQFYLQLQTERSHGGPEVERSDVAPSPSPLQASGNGVQEAGELLSQTKETGSFPLGQGQGLAQSDPLEEFSTF